MSSHDKIIAIIIFILVLCESQIVAVHALMKNNEEPIFKVSLDHPNICLGWVVRENNYKLMDCQ